MVRRALPKRKRIWALWFIIIGFLGVLVSCGPTKLALSRAHMTPRGMIAAPALLPNGATLQTWETVLKPALQTNLQAQVFGFMPTSSSTKIINREVLAKSAFNGSAQIEEYTLIATASYEGTANSTNVTKPFKMLVLTPTNAPSPVPVILMESFCPNHDTVPHAAVSKPDDDGFSCGGGAVTGGIMKFVFGRYIAAPPHEMIMRRGYALAVTYPSEYVPDRKVSALPALEALAKGHNDEATRWGAIAAWGWGYSRMIDALVTDPRYDTAAMITYGHSRYGKAALVAAAYDLRIDGVIAHQSGTGGASLNKQKKGESIGDITDTFPHWFSRAYSAYAGREEDMSVDQHGLLALIAPRPIFLGNARRDVWSDPNGAFRAAQAASAVYRLYGKQGLAQTGLRAFRPGADISFYIRPGTHGVVKEDWPAFLDFLDAHYK